MPAARLFLRAALLLTLAGALFSGAAAGAGRILPDSGTIYFSQVGGSYSLYMLDPQRLVRYNLSARHSIPADLIASPDGRKLAFVHRDSALDLFEVRVFDFATLQTTAVYSTPSSVIDAVYSWSPSGRYLSFRSGSTLLKYDFLTGETSPVIGNNRDDYFNDSFPVWSADEKQIAFVSSLREAQTWQGYLVNADGSDLHRVTRVDVCQFYAPRWSPSGSTLALNANCENVPTVFVLNAETGKLRALSDLDVPTWEPLWSFDGSRLLFIAGTQERRIYTTTPDGSDLRYVANGDFAHWSPDGQSILFSSSAGDLYTIGADGGNLQRLTYSEGKPYLLAMGWSR